MTANKIISGIVIIVWLCVFYAVAFGQGMGFGLTGPLTFVGFSAGEPVWAVGGNSLRIQVAPGVLQKHLKDLEGHEVTISLRKVK